MDAPEIDNRTELLVEPHQLLGKDGEQLVTLIKGTYEQDGAGGLVEAPPERRRGFRYADSHWGDPATSAPKYPCDGVGYKPNTDVVVVAVAHAPEGRQVDSFDVAVQVGPLKKSLQIFGLRVWQERGAGLSAPRPLLAQEIRYDHAWGGLDDSDLTDVHEEPRNPVGRGIARDPDALTHQRAPCIEDPDHLIRSVRTEPPPAGLGPLGPHWKPRRDFMGTYDEAWQRDQAPLLPTDHDSRANQCGSPGLVSSAPLKGNELLALMNLTPGGGLLEVTLPAVQPVLIRDEVGHEPVELRPHLDTIVIDTMEVTAPSRVTVELLWRTVTRFPRRMKDLRVLVTEDRRSRRSPA